MTTQLAVEGTPALSEVVAGNIRAEAARRGMSQTALALGMGMNRTSVSQRSSGHTPWTLDEVERAARLFDVRPADLLVRQQGLEPRTRWLNGQLAHLEAVAA